MTKSQMQENRRYRTDLMKWFERMFECYAKLSEEEKVSFHDWDANRPGGVGTSDWPGWEKYIGKAPFRR